MHMKINSGAAETRDQGGSRAGSMDAQRYKAHHEDMMSGHSGSGALHTLAAALLPALACAASALLPARPRRRRLLAECALLAPPLVLAHTLLAANAAPLALLLLPALLLAGRRAGLAHALDRPNKFPGARLDTVTNLRGLTHLTTALCILAVDFSAFPRYLAKTERHGYSLMDTGVGLFVIGSGLVHKRATAGLLATLRRDSKQILVPLLLGVARCFLIQKLDYHEHVTEYGAHWNFFFTIAAAKLLSILLLQLTDSNFPLFWCIKVKIWHEMFLTVGLERWVLSEVPRDGIINANREGLSSCLGYVSMYLFGVYIRQLLTDKTVKRYKVLQNLFLVFITLSVISFICNLIKPTSRVLANSSYCTYIETLIVLLLMILYLLEVALHENSTSSVPLIIDCINNNGLLFFLAANLLTGLVNFAFRTFLLGIWETMVILNLYMLVLITFAFFLEKHGVKLS